jgi:hypothetical protein
MTKDCPNCGCSMEVLFSTDGSVAVNQYSRDADYQKKKQKGLLCQNCKYFFNDHAWSMSELFDNYKYSSPDSQYLEPILDEIKSFSRDKRISKVCEVGGNSGLFLSKLKGRMPEVECTNIDKWHEIERFPEVRSVNTFVDEASGKLLEPLAPELVICRHMFAHNPNVKTLLSNILEQFNRPKFIYIENASLEETIDQSDFGQFYAEHYYAFTPFSVSKLLEIEGYRLVKYQSFEIHNGSFGMFFSRSSGHEVKFDFRDFDNKAIRDKFSVWLDDCFRFEEKIIASNFPISLYAVSAKFVFTANAFLSSEFRNSFVSIYDNTPQKRGLIPPGFECPVEGDSDLNDLSDDSCLIIGARNFYEEIEKKLEAIGIVKERLICPPF